MWYNAYSKISTMKGGHFMTKQSLRKRIPALLLALGLAAAMTGCRADSARIDARVTVSPDKAITTNGGAFEGWGTSLCWWANRLGYSDTLAQLAADAIFGADGLHLNIMRYNIGGGDDPAHSHITRTDSAVPGWLKWDDESQSYVYDYAADHNQLNVMQRAVKAAGEDALVEVFSNSPPYFMTESGCSSGAEKANQNNLRADCTDDFAKYLAHVTAYIRSEMGMPVVSLSPMNEPNTDYWKAYSNKQEGCHVDAGKSQSAILEATADAMAQYGLESVTLAASDETSPKLQQTAWNGYSGKAKQAVGRINTHTYSDSGARQLGKLAAKEGFNLWMSEVDGAGTAGKNAGEMGAALWLGQKIIADISALSPSAWVMWQAIDSHISAEGYNGNKDTGMVDVNGGFWGVAVADHDKEEIILTQKYYGFGQFTRYIRPGSTLIPCTKSALAAYHHDTGELAIVLLNTADKEKTVSVDLSAFGSIGSGADVYRTSGSMQDGEHWAALDPIPTDAAGVTVPLKGNSITTLVVGDVRLP